MFRIKVLQGYPSKLKKIFFFITYKSMFFKNHPFQALLFQKHEYTHVKETYINIASPLTVMGVDKLSGCFR